MAGTIAVCVPVRDEASRLPRFLGAMAAQTDTRFTLCLLFDGCTDASAAIVAEWMSRLPMPILTRSVAAGEPNAGRARRLAMEVGRSVVGRNGAILCTDADSSPAPGWLAANLAALEQADVVAGRIVRGPGAVLSVQDRVEAYYDALFSLRRRLDPVPWEATRTHHYASGASLAFRVEAYDTLGGFDPVPSGEDGRIVDAAHRAGLRVRRDATVVVETSARRQGRATDGLADHLRRLDHGGAAPTMSHPEDCAWRYAMHARARGAFGAELAALAASLGRPAADIAAEAAASPNAEAFATRIVPCAPGGERLVTLDVAEQALVRLDATPRRQAA